MIEILENMTEAFAMLGLSMLLVFWFLIWITLKLNKKRKIKMKRVPIDYELIKEINDALAGIKNKNDKLMVASEQLKEHIEKLESKNIDTLLNAINNPGSRIIAETFQILEDNRITLKDSGPALRIISAISEIAKNFRDLKCEVNDLDGEEVEILTLAAVNEGSKIWKSMR